VEFLGASQGEVHTVSKRLEKDAVRTSVVASIFSPKPGSIGPNLGQILAVKDVTGKYKSEDFSSGQQFPVYSNLRDKKGDLKLKAPVGLVSPAKNYGKDIETFVGDPDLLITFRAYEVQESIPRYKKEEVDLPPEEYIRPGWYGDCWHSAQIGKVYEEFFRTGAITDTQQITDSEGSTTGVSSSDALSAMADSIASEGPEDPRADTLANFTLAKGASIEDAVAFPGVDLFVHQAEAARRRGVHSRLCLAPRRLDGRHVRHQ
jgi:hypothetical protein